MSSTLILTATITPPEGVPDLKRTDPALRKRDYLETLEFYLSVPTSTLRRIIFVENSGSDLDDLRALASASGSGKEVEFLGFRGLDHPPQYGRGYGEFKLLDHALANSSTLTAMSPEEAFWKATGRYRVLNLARMIATAPDSYDLYCDLKDRPIPWMDLRIFSCTVAGYRRLIEGLYPRLREDQTAAPPETVFRAHIGARIAEGGIVPRFRVEPFVAGIRGSDNRSYVLGKNYLKYQFRSISRRLAPRVWI